MGSDSPQELCGFRIYMVQAYTQYYIGCRGLGYRMYPEEMTLNRLFIQGFRHIFFPVSGACRCNCCGQDGFATLPLLR